MDIGPPWCLNLGGDSLLARADEVIE